MWAKWQARISARISGEKQLSGFSRARGIASAYFIGTVPYTGAGTLPAAHGSASDYTIPSVLLAWGSGGVDHGRRDKTAHSLRRR